MVIDQEAYSSINHKSQNILYAVKCHYTAIDPFPQAFVTQARTTFNHRAQFGDVLGVVDGNLKVWALLVALKAE